MCKSAYNSMDIYIYKLVVSNIFNFHPYLAKMNPFWLIFFRGVGSTTNQYTSIFDEVLCVGDTFDDVEKVICSPKKSPPSGESAPDSSIDSQI